MGLTGVVFNIQKFSIHDGPGIRTTVFLKGCPMRCRWCSNPESQLPRIQIMYHGEDCMHCQSCVHTCPQKAISLTESGRVHIDGERCNACLACVRDCPGRALSNEGEVRTVREVYEVCLQDLAFYEESGGGVTIPGCETMAQPDFTEALVRMLKERGISTAVETTGCVSPQIFQRLAPLFDLLLYDVKHYDTEKHKEGTGVGNERIVENLRWAQDGGLRILPRIPVIPGFNAELRDAEGLACLLGDIGLGEAQLLPFHQMGERKYEFLNREYGMAGIGPLHPEDLTEYRQTFLDRGIHCFF